MIFLQSHHGKETFTSVIWSQIERSFYLLYLASNQAAKESRTPFISRFSSQTE